MVDPEVLLGYLPGSVISIHKIGYAAHLLVYKAWLTLPSAASGSIQYYSYCIFPLELYCESSY